MSSSNQRYESDDQKRHTCPEQAVGEEPNHERDDRCGQDEQQDFGDEYDDHDADDEQQDKQQQVVDWRYVEG